MLWLLFAWSCYVYRQYSWAWKSRLMLVANWCWDILKANKGKRKIRKKRKEREEKEEKKKKNLCSWPVWIICQLCCFIDEIHVCVFSFLHLLGISLHALCARVCLHVPMWCDYFFLWAHYTRLKSIFSPVDYLVDLFLETYIRVFCAAICVCPFDCLCVHFWVVNYKVGLVIALLNWRNYLELLEQILIVL